MATVESYPSTQDVMPAATLAVSETHILSSAQHNEIDRLAQTQEGNLLPLVRSQHKGTLLKAVVE